MVILTSFRSVGVPLLAYVGANEGNQKSGSLALRASACSSLISFKAASSASSASLSTLEGEKLTSSLRFSPLADKMRKSEFQSRVYQTYNPIFHLQRLLQLSTSPTLTQLQIRKRIATFRILSALCLELQPSLLSFPLPLPSSIVPTWLSAL